MVIRYYCFTYYPGIVLTVTASIKRIGLICTLLILAACQSLITPHTETVIADTRCECADLVVRQPDETIAKTPVCPAAATASRTPTAGASKAKIINDLLVIGRVENVTLLPGNTRLKARIDTGAGLTSLNAQALVFFERDGASWVRFSVPTEVAGKVVTLEKPVKRYVNIKQHSGESQRRPIVEISLKLGAIEEPTDASLADRSAYLYPLLVGRNFLRDRAMVDVSTKFTIPSRQR